ncbi:MAG: hypothetical protein Kow0010_03350 [Dehalococcoidia bacterium]
MPNLVPLEALPAGAADRSTIGGKAASLGRLIAAGFDVPPGFVVPTTVPAEHGDDPRAWPATLRDELLQRFRHLTCNGGAVAVRSSAADEDSERASFAGQYETILDVRDEDGLLDAISRCLASLHTDAARAYRQAAGHDDADARMAVVVQRMVPADYAGVIFTVDPATGDTGRVVIEAVRGTGEALVAGTAEGERIVLERETMAVVDDHRPGEPVLSADAARSLARLALRVEETFASPQDIEFAVAGGQAWLLQARPVTTAASSRGWRSEFDTPCDSGQEWTSANIQEVLPGLLTPLTMSTFMQMQHASYTAMYQQVGLADRDEFPLSFGFFYNRAFLNLTTGRMMTARSLGGDPQSLEHRFLGGEQAETRMEHSLRLWRYRLRSAIPGVRLVFGAHRRADRADRATLAVEAREQAIDPATLTDAEIDTRTRRLAEFSARIFRAHLAATSCSGLGFESVARMLRPILGDETEAQLPTLFSGMREVESARISLDLWDLSRVALVHGIAGRLDEPGFDPRDPSLPAAWHEAFNAFLQRHGHRGINEVDPACHPWRDDPAPVVRTVAAYAALRDDQSPAATLERQARERERLTDELARRMPAVQRPLFRWMLRRAQGWVALRERTKSIFVRSARLGDPYLRETQRRFLERGIISEPSDFFFLTVDEVSSILQGVTPPGLEDRIIRRRREYERNRHVRLPERFHGHPEPLEPDPAHHAGEVLQGTGVSPGVVTARARVILDPNTDGPMQPGEVLVAPVTDAGWTPLFALASGLVVDMGSALSHGSTVAREYGLPAVVNVRRGTTAIRTGDLVTVNGSSGTVTVVETPGDD